MEFNLTMLTGSLIGLVAGAIIALCYIIGNRDTCYSKNFAITLILLPAVVAFIIPVISTDLKKAVSLAGIFTMVRFRSIPGDSKDLLFVFLTLASGISIGLEYYTVSICLILIVCVLFVIFEHFVNVNPSQVLKITIPEDMNYSDVFDETFKKYLAKSSLSEVRTSNMGTLFTLTYRIRCQKNADMKKFMDELRCKNGNLSIILQTSDAISRL